MRISTKVSWEDLAARGIPASDIKKITWPSDGSTEIEFVDPAKEATEQSEIAAMKQVATIIDGINNLADAKVFLKRLCKRLIRNGVLP